MKHEPTAQQPSAIEQPADDYGLHELLDRTHMVLAMIDDFLLQHKDTGSQLDVKAHFEKASEELSKAYLRIGEIHLK